ncbi:hypothetical protein EDD22DRAFT_447309 [Suillus occidentalis]|nr:hypothetical protein EDD22DRAFT_447309 [Suillus occidentalis]
MASPLLVPILVRASSLSRCLVFSNSKLQPVPILVCASVLKFEVAACPSSCLQRPFSCVLVVFSNLKLQLAHPPVSCFCCSRSFLAGIRRIFSRTTEIL